MIRLLLDTNFLLDLLVSDRPGSESAAALAQAIDEGRFEAEVSAGSLKDVYYVACKYADEQIVRSMIEAFMDAYTVKAVDSTICRMAIRSCESDFEGGIIRAVAETSEADVIITRDEKAFAGSLVKSMSAEAFLAAVCEKQQCAIGRGPTLLSE